MLIFIFFSHIYLNISIGLIQYILLMTQRFNHEASAWKKLEEQRLGRGQIFGNFDGPPNSSGIPIFRQQNMRQQNVKQQNMRQQNMRQQNMRQQNMRQQNIGLFPNSEQMNSPRLPPPRIVNIQEMFINTVQKIKAIEIQFQPEFIEKRKYQQQEERRIKAYYNKKHRKEMGGIRIRWDRQQKKNMRMMYQPQDYSDQFDQQLQFQKKMHYNPSKNRENIHHEVQFYDSMKRSRSLVNQNYERLQKLVKKNIHLLIKLNVLQPRIILIGQYTLLKLYNQYKQRLFSIKTTQSSVLNRFIQQFSENFVKKHGVKHGIKTIQSKKKEEISKKILKKPQSKNKNPISSDYYGQLKSEPYLQRQEISYANKNLYNTEDSEDRISKNIALILKSPTIQQVISKALEQIQRWNKFFQKNAKKEEIKNRFLTRIETEQSSIYYKRILYFFKAIQLPFGLSDYISSKVRDHTSLNDQQYINLNIAQTLKAQKKEVPNKRLVNETIFTAFVNYFRDTQSANINSAKKDIILLDSKQFEQISKNIDNKSYLLNFKRVIFLVCSNTNYQWEIITFNTNQLKIYIYYSNSKTKQSNKNLQNFKKRLSEESIRIDNNNRMHNVETIYQQIGLQENNPQQNILQALLTLIFVIDNFRSHPNRKIYLDKNLIEKIKNPIYKTLVYLSYCHKFKRQPRKDYFSYILRNPIYSQRSLRAQEQIQKDQLRQKFNKIMQSNP